MNTRNSARNYGLRIDREPLLNEVDVLKWLKVSRPTLRKFVNSGSLTAVEMTSRRQYRVRDVIDFIESHSTRKETRKI